jgi:16S rRNA (guanine527-N7)-methyltransferase
MKQLIQQGLNELSLTTPPEAAEKLERYGTLLLEKNQVMNLTAITDPLDVVNLHFLDCAALLSCTALECRSLIDVGTGAGFPGIVLKILVPSLKLTLLDGLQKRLTWLEELCEALSLDNVQFIHGRAEELGHNPLYREQYDVATARAVAGLNTLSELCLPFVTTGGEFLAMKTADCQEDQASSSAIELLGGQLGKPYLYQIPRTKIERKVICIRKLAPTPPAYPRRWAKIQKSPL